MLSALFLLAAASIAPLALANMRYAGVNIAGCDFGCNIYGYCNGIQCPSEVGPLQMKQFTQVDGLNIFRLPVGWQYLVQNDLGGSINNSFFPTYDAIVQSCLNTTAHCIVDVHNYARWNGKIIGQGGPSNDDFTSLWSQLASYYKNEPRVVFGIMNEPWGVNMTLWTETVQQVVDAIRAAGATSQLILLPGTDYTNAGSFPWNSGPLLQGVQDTNGTTKKLIFDVHQYYDASNTGTELECVSNEINSSYSPLADYLRKVKRRALLSETGGGNVPSCINYIGDALEYLNQNSDVYMGWLGWAAGSFDTSYNLTLTPFLNGTNQYLLEDVFMGKFKLPIVST